MDMKQQRALVTGSTAGIGREIALQLGGRVAEVVVTGRDEQRGAATVAAIEARRGHARFVATDFSDLAAVRRLAEEAGEIDVLVNNAGSFPFAPTVEQTVEEFDATFTTNVRSLFFLTASLVPGMVARGHGAIVNLTTMAAEFGLPGAAVYGASKAAVASLTRTWAAEFGPAGVRVNAVSPGPTRTEGTAVMGDSLDQLAATAPLGRPATPSEIAAAVVFAVSPEASFLHGAVIPVDGGRTAV